MKKLIASCALLLSACASTFTGPYESSGAYVGDMNRDRVVVRWVRVPQSNIGEVCNNKLDNIKTSLLDTNSGMVDHAPVSGMISSGPSGCATMGWELNVGATCTIYLPVPASDYGIALLGHEALHCFIGEYHY